MSKNFEHLQSVARRKSAVDWFRGVVKQAHLHVRDTGEHFTIEHRGDRLDVFEGLRHRKTNVIIPLGSENLEWLANAFSDDVIDPQEEHAIVKYLLEPCLRAALEIPILRNPAVSRILKVDQHWQEALVDPSGQPDVELTILYINKQWLVVPGFHGKPQRRLRLTARQFLDFQKKVFEADAGGNLADWIKLANWYVKWRDSVSVPTN
ncbi:MAG: hypothetical protein AB1758_16850 [Candidatus Eremiobacterota bacterium]